jgi:glucan phosphoethanolaminetransferase (alkaline phosphatase superfamily)
MNEEEFQAEIDALPRGMRFVVNHVVVLSIGVFVLFGALLVVVLLVHAKLRTVIATFCVLAMAMALLNMTVFSVTRRRLMSSEHGTDS